jgi:uncharacterized protein YkwD
MRSPTPISTTRTPLATGSSPAASSSARRRLAVALAAFLFVGTFAVITATAPSAHAMDGDYLAKINALRTSRGLNALQVDGNMDALAQQHTAEMAGSQTLVHTANLKAGVTSNWTKVGENVGEGGSNNQIWDAFLNSPKHLANLLDPAFTHVGIGVVVDSAGIQWTTHRFVAITAAAPVTQPPAPVVTAPPVTRPPVTAPPTTRKPVVVAPPTTAAPVVTTVPPSSNGTGDGSGAGTADGGDGGTGGLVVGETPANPNRVGSVIDSLRALD